MLCVSARRVVRRARNYIVARLMGGRCGRVEGRVLYLVIAEPFLLRHYCRLASVLTHGSDSLIDREAESWKLCSFAGNSLTPGGY